jgi:D-glycero-D-manno-heptose 1,7-bisphosphate phosphatase
VQQITISAVLLDRDGVINRELGRGLRSWQEFEFLPGVLRAFEQLSALAVPIVVVSNQSAIGRGWVDAETVAVTHRRMIQSIRTAGGRIDDVLICPHAPEAGCPCRKPLPGLLLEAAAKHGFDVRRALMVGDSYRDVQAGRAAGAIPIMVRSGHAIPPNLEEWLLGDNIIMAADLAAVVEAINNGTLFSGAEGERHTHR